MQAYCGLCISAPRLSQLLTKSWPDCCFLHIWEYYLSQVSQGVGSTLLTSHDLQHPSLMQASHTSWLMSRLPVLTRALLLCFWRLLLRCCSPLVKERERERERERDLLQAPHQRVSLWQRPPSRQLRGTYRQDPSPASQHARASIHASIAATTATSLNFWVVHKSFIIIMVSFGKLPALGGCSG